MNVLILGQKFEICKTDFDSSRFYLKFDRNDTAASKVVDIFKKTFKCTWEDGGIGYVFESHLGFVGEKKWLIKYIKLFNERDGLIVMKNTAPKALFSGDFKDVYLFPSEIVTIIEILSKEQTKVTKSLMKYFQHVLRNIKFSGTEKYKGEIRKKFLAVWNSYLITCDEDGTYYPTEMLRRLYLKNNNRTLEDIIIDLLNLRGKNEKKIKITQKLSGEKRLGVINRDIRSVTTDFTLRSEGASSVTKEILLEVPKGIKVKVKYI